jgi:hypothetical protein
MCIRYTYTHMYMRYPCIWDTLEVREYVRPLVMKRPLHCLDRRDTHPYICIWDTHIYMYASHTHMYICVYHTHIRVCTPSHSWSGTCIVLRALSVWKPMRSGGERASTRRSVTITSSDVTRSRAATSSPPLLQWSEEFNGDFWKAFRIRCSCCCTPTKVNIFAEICLVKY